MTGKRIGYIRVSSLDQNFERQLEGVTLDRCFIDKASGKDTARPQLKEMLNYVRDGDVIIVHSMDRLARNIDDLRKLVQQLTEQKIKIEFLKECLIFTGEDAPISQLLLSVMGAFAEFERSLIRERQREGIAIAKKKGLYKGRKPSLSDDQIAELKNRVANGEKKTVIALSLGVSRETLYQYLRKYQNK
jgi:DNA invertase Pin-like site-specific DNA recombinase